MSLFIYIIYINCVQVISNYTFYEVTAYNMHERELLYKVQQTHVHAYFLNEVTNEAATTMDIVVDTCCTQHFEQSLFKYDIDFSAVANHTPYSYDYGEAHKFLQKNALQTFLNWDDIILWVETKVKEYTVLTKTVIAKTYEHRDVFVLKLSTGAGKKMSVFVVAGEEGRDWLSSAILLNYINKTLESSSSSKSLLNYYDIYFVPIFNPDGFVYTKIKDRLWTKNRKLILPTKICNNFEVAVGVNLDRNWFHEISDSKNACNSVYWGSKSLSEEETQGLSYILNSIALKLLAFINLRGYGNLITIPYSNNKKISSNHNIVMEIMKHTSAVLKMQYNKSYPVGTTASYFYNFSGNMPDWVKRQLNIPIVFTAYMQHNNFFPKESDILPLTNQLDSLLNISLVISKEIYGSLYNNQKRNSSLSFLITIICINLCIIKLF